MAGKNLFAHGAMFLCGAAALVTSLTLGGCKDDTTTQPTAQTVTVSMKDDTVLVTPYNFKPGKTIFKVTNNGTKPHGIEVEEAATEKEARTSILAAGASAELTNFTAGGKGAGAEIIVTEGVWEFYDWNSGTAEFPKVEIDVRK